MEAPPCICLNEPIPFNQYRKVKYLGQDTTNGRYGSVTLLSCKTCDRYWLRYEIEYEAIGGSGRYFLGLISLETANNLSALTAVEYLNSLDWHLYGGSYFSGKKGKGTGRVQVDF